MSFLTDLENFFTHFNQANFDTLVADIQQDVQVAEADLARAAAWLVANGPTIVADAQTLVSVLAALTGHLTIPVSVISVLETTVADLQQFVGAVGKVASVTTAGFMSALAAVPDGNESPGTLLSGYKMHQSVLSATVAARLALATAKKK
jgi:hypothetical protein